MARGDRVQKGVHCSGSKNPELSAGCLTHVPPKPVRAGQAEQVVASGRGEYASLYAWNLGNRRILAAFPISLVSRFFEEMGESAHPFETVGVRGGLRPAEEPVRPLRQAPGPNKIRPGPGKSFFLLYMHKSTCDNWQ